MGGAKFNTHADEKLHKTCWKIVELKLLQRGYHMSRLYSPTSALYPTPYYSFPSAAFATHLTHSPHTPALQLILGFSTTLSFNFGNKCEPPLRMRPRPRLPLSLPLLAGDEDNIVCKLSDNRLPPILTWLVPLPPPLLFPTPCPLGVGCLFRAHVRA